MQVTHGGFHCEVGTKRSGNAVKQNRLLEDESLQGDGIFFKRRQTIMSEKPKYYITTAIAYASGKPHIGNTYEIVLADAIARYKRSQGYDVFFQTGTDEHGQKIELKADEAGVTPKEFVDNVSGEIKRIWDLMNTSYDKFIRTTDDYHEKQVQKIFKKLYDQIAAGNVAAVIDKQLFRDDGKANWQMFNQNVGQNYIADQVLSDMRKIEAMFCTDVGIPNANTDKKERLITDEVNANKVETRSKCDLWLEELKESCEKVREMFGIKLDVDWRYKGGAEDGNDEPVRTV